MDDVHAFGPDPLVEKFKEDLSVHIWCFDGGVHREGAEYDYEWIDDHWTQSEVA